MSDVRWPRTWAFRLPEYLAPRVTDDWLERVVGTHADLSLLGEPVHTVRITAARRYEDPILGPGVWVETDQTQ